MLNYTVYEVQTDKVSQFNNVFKSILKVKRDRQFLMVG